MKMKKIISLKITCVFKKNVITMKFNQYFWSKNCLIIIVNTYQYSYCDVYFINYIELTLLKTYLSTAQNKKTNNLSKTEG